jgi:phosphoribosylamine--glycine ligase
VCVVLASEGYPGKPKVGRVISGIATAETHGGVKVFHAGTKFENPQLLSTGGRVLGVTATAEDLPSAIACAYTAVSKIEFAGMHFRHDIGAKGLKRLSRDTRTRVSGGRAGKAPAPRDAS